MQKLHPLSKFPGPWYASSFSIVSAIVSVLRKEPQWLMYLEKKYGTDHPIRISPTLLLFPKPSSLRDIYRDPQCNTKGGLYRAGSLGPASLVTTIDGERHRLLRKALSNAPWTIGPLKNEWESRFDDHISLFIQKFHEHAEANRTICLSDKVSEFALDILGMIAFSRPFGCVEQQRDVNGLLSNFRKALPIFGFSGRFNFFREKILTLPFTGALLLPSPADEAGMGWLLGEAGRQIAAREEQNAEKQFEGRPDFLQHCLDARYSDGSSLSAIDKHAHITLLIQAGADTTGTAMGMVLQYMISNPSILARAREEIEAAEARGVLSTPVRYDEVREHLPYFVACIKEGIRLGPSAANYFSRVIPAGGKVIDGHYIPAGTDVTCYSYVVQRNKDFYGADAEEYKPERWLQSQQRAYELEAAQFTFGTGPRVCVGKDVAILESHKLLPEIIRQFDFEVKQFGQYVVTGGVAANEGFMVNVIPRKQT
ncbi:uncharacterized protein SETTUDRAFT_124398 [Exserohilum turcica Et28A]|uniref:Cytochrome P450 n=1 Tax=Exserohilum turcicum (strain 28A) TaxID=671987 RepID=R0JXJ0_EXST2|nr:uncharacterized protein SETTUDRAFT_124398 [Exserohilum turcica Et28A]EOA80982.1 hypothetical protein SETTUDRAFT_124398 [Exserohilum turcica Et28A]